jgi:hypothetical protein
MSMGGPFAVRVICHNSRNSCPILATRTVLGLPDIVLLLSTVSKLLSTVHSACTHMAFQLHEVANTDSIPWVSSARNDHWYLADVIVQ